MSDSMCDTGDEIHDWIVELRRLLKLMHADNPKQFRDHLEYVAGILLTDVEELDADAEDAKMIAEGECDG